MDIRLGYIYIKIDENFKSQLTTELINSESTQQFVGAFQNYFLLKGQRNNLYKCILVNCLSLASKDGIIGLIHPEGVYDDPAAKYLRKFLYHRLLFHFEFKNSLFLFAEVHDQKNYSINVYSSEKSHPEFDSINNLFLCVCSSNKYSLLISL